MLATAMRVPGVAEMLGPLVRVAVRQAFLPTWFRRGIAKACATNMAIPMYVRQFEATTAPGVVLTFAAKPRLSMTALAYYWGLQDFEPATTQVFFRLAKSSRVTVDVGASTGVFSLLAAKACPTCRVIAVEPHPIVAASLARTVRAASLRTIEVVPIALGSTEGMTPLYTTASDTLTSIDSRRVPDAVPMTVPMSTLDSLVRTMGLQAIDLLKVDVEGWELHVFKGAYDALRRFRPTVIFEVLADAPIQELEAVFRELEYRFYTPDLSGLRPVQQLQSEKGLIERNAIAVATEKIGLIEQQSLGEAQASP